MSFAGTEYISDLKTDNAGRTTVPHDVVFDLDLPLPDVYCKSYRYRWAILLAMACAVFGWSASNFAFRSVQLEQMKALNSDPDI